MYFLHEACTSTGYQVFLTTANVYISLVQAEKLIIIAGVSRCAMYSKKPFWRGNNIAAKAWQAVSNQPLSESVRQYEQYVSCCVRDVQLHAVWFGCFTKTNSSSFLLNDARCQAHPKSIIKQRDISSMLINCGTRKARIAYTKDRRVYLVHFEVRYIYVRQLNWKIINYSNNKIILVLNVKE